MKEGRQENARLLEEIVQLRKKLEDTAFQLDAANKELDSFSYSVSHDLRAPLRAINGNAQILEEDFPDQFNTDARKHLTRIRDNAARMEQLINDLLSFSRIGRKVLGKAHIDMNALVTAVLADRRTSQPHSARVEVHALPETYGDYTLVKQVWTNLISNAIKYSSGKEQPVIEVGAETTDNTVTYYVRDNGAGFDMAYAGNLFGMFQRLHDATEFEGNGMGLAVAQRIVLKHGGTIRGEGVPGEGAVFRFTIGR